MSFIINSFVFSTTQLIRDQLTSPDNLIALWFFNTLSGTSVIDQSGNGHTMTMSANISTMTPTGRSITFSGSEYWTVEDKADLSFGNGTADGSFSIMVYGKPTFDTTFRYDLYKGGAYPNYEYLLYQRDSDVLTLSLWDASASAYRNALSSVQSTPVNNTLYTGTYNGNEANPLAGLNIYKDTSNINNSTAETGSYTSMENLSVGLISGNNEHSGLIKGSRSVIGIISEELDVTQIGNIKTILSNNFD
jgi:hypothetical protein